MIRRLRPVALAALAALAATVLAAAGARAEEDAARGAYLAAAAGCKGCHTAKDGAPFAGGRALKTPMGTFYGPNITPDPAHGIGAWSEAEFLAALRRGIGRSGENLFPAFPYVAYTGITDDDARAIRAYLLTVPPSAEPSRPHALRFPFGLRPLVRIWKWLHFTPGPFAADPDRGEAWNRGAYLVEALGHCGECHTPRDRMGGLVRARANAGTADGPEGKRVPNITPHAETGIGKWSENDVVYFLETGFLPDGDAAGSLMEEVVRESTSKLDSADRRAIAVYLKSLPPIDHKPAKAK